jgi:hypothetical protein
MLLFELFDSPATVEVLTISKEILRLSVGNKSEKILFTALEERTEHPKYPNIILEGYLVYFGTELKRQNNSGKSLVSYDTLNAGHPFKIFPSVIEATKIALNYTQNQYAPAIWFTARTNEENRASLYRRLLKKVPKTDYNVYEINKQNTICFYIIDKKYDLFLSKGKQSIVSN